MSGPGFWLWHAFASLLGAAAVAWLAPRLQHGLRVSAASRGYWLGAWALALLPAPLAITLHGLAPSAVAVALPVLAPLDDLPGAIAASDVAIAAAASSLPLGYLLLWLYGAGVAFGALRWGLALDRLRRLLRTSRPLDPADLPGIASRGECEQLRARGIVLARLDAALSPFALRWPRPTIVLPQALFTRLDDAQLRLVLRHEAAHLARRDPHCALLLRLGGLLLWFNPWLRSLARRVQLAAELACDAAALGAPAPPGAEKNMRRAYAEAYLQTLRMSMAPALPCPAIAFSPQDQGSHRMRIGHIVHGDPHARKRPLRSLALGALALLCGGGLVAVQAATAAPAAIAFNGPIIDGRISSPYGVVRASVGPKRHNGIDLSAARGTPVRAPAAATVQVATEHYAPQPNYGSVIILDHGDGWQTVYAHLDALDVRAGEQVEAGQQIGRLGSTGKATGPHVHVEVHQHGKRVDPATVISSLVTAP